MTNNIDSYLSDDFMEIKMIIIMYYIIAYRGKTENEKNEKKQTR